MPNESGGRAFTEIVPDVKKKTLEGIIRGQVALDSTIISDGFRDYDGLVDVDYEAHLRLKKHHDRPTRTADGEVHINGIEAFWNFTKRRPVRFNSSRVNFQLHLKDSERT